MKQNEWIAMVLAGGRGTGLGALTRTIAKSAVLFGGQYRIIDFTLSNCKHSGLDTVGILTQYQPLALHAYVGNGAAWELDRHGGGVHILPPYVRENGGQWYTGSADAVYQNCDFIEQYNPQYVVVLSGDHIYQLDYSRMLAQHKQQQADVTIAVSKSNQIAIGVYIFNWDVLQQYLAKDAAAVESEHDFARDIIPAMVSGNQHLATYQLDGYWRNVGTLTGYWEANMELLGEAPPLVLTDPNWPVYSPPLCLPPHYHGAEACVKNSLIGGGSMVLGEVDTSIIFPGVYVGKDVMVKNSIVMSHARLEQGAVLDGVIVTQHAVVVGNDWRDTEHVIQVAAPAKAKSQTQMELAG